MKAKIFKFHIDVAIDELKLTQKEFNEAYLTDALGWLECAEWHIKRAKKAIKERLK